MRLWGFFLVAVFLFSCSAGGFSETELNSLLSNERVFARNAAFSVLKPYGWLNVAENKYDVAELWLVKNDYSETISLNKINAPEKTTLDEIFAAAVRYRKINYGNRLNGFEKLETKIGEKNFPGFEYTDDKGKNVFVYLCEEDEFFIELVYETPEKKRPTIALAVLNSIKTDRTIK